MSIIKTDEVELYAVHLFEPQLLSHGARYSVVMKFPKNDALPSGLEEIAEDGINYGEMFAGYYTLRASSRYRPEVIDADCNPITDSASVYDGCFGRVCLSLRPRVLDDGQVALLHSVQITRQGGERTPKAAVVFGKFEHS